MSEVYGWGYNKRYFDRLLWLSYPGWAWEFKRRDPDLFGLFRVSRSSVVDLDRTDGSRLIRLRRKCHNAAKLGLHFIPDPRLSAYETPVFWLSEVMATNLSVAAEICSYVEREIQPLKVEDIPGKKSILVVPGQQPLLTVSAKRFSAQLTISGSSGPAPIAIYLTLRSGVGSDLLQKISCMERFARFCSGLKLDTSPKRGFSNQSLRNSLIALDGWLSGASQRQIAQRLFGYERVFEDWESETFSYKSRTRRLIRKGRALMEKDYLKLL